MSSRPFIVLRDINPEMAMAWTQSLSHLDGVSFGVGDLLISGVDAIVSPANSFGYMDGGIDLAYRNMFGGKVEIRLKELISRREEEELPIGAAVVVPTGHPRITRMIAAPTMRTPSPIVGTQNVYRATKAALRVLPDIDPPVERLGFPGMGTGIGRMDPFEAADQMRRAFEEWMES